MKKYFNVNLEFNHKKLEEKVVDVAFNSKGYCCFVDLTSLVYSHNNNSFKKILNNSTINSCDGSYIALYSSKIHDEQNKAYIGPDFFKKFIFSKGIHVIVGSTKEVFIKIIKNTEEEKISSIHHLDLPFKKVEDFNYQEIAGKLSSLNPNFIWVSLGAPKQEIFMSKLLPFLDKGIMLGVGAAVNYFSGEIKDIPNWTKKLHVVWVYRLLTEPKKQIKRLKTIFLTFPKMVREEKILKNNYE